MRRFSCKRVNNYLNHDIYSSLLPQKLFMVAQLEHGSLYMAPQSDPGELISPSVYVTNQDPLQRRRHSAFSVESLDSDDEMGLNEPFRANNLTRYPSDGTINTEIMNPENEEEEKKENEDRKRKESVTRRTEATSERLPLKLIYPMSVPKSWCIEVLRNCRKYRPSIPMLVDYVPKV